MLISFDDTDGPDGGCTTHEVFRVLLALPHLALRSMPRLVRLDPNVPWKTRGNAAVVLDLGEPQGPQVRVGELRGREVLAFPEAPPTSLDEADVDAAWSALQAGAREAAKPAVVGWSHPPSRYAYDAAVRTEVAIQEAKAILAAEGAIARSTGDGRGLVGCVGAAAWPGPASSYEFIAYREPPNRGSPRQVDPAPLRSLDGTDATFHTWDPEEDLPACIPGTPCPVLLGLRGRDPEALRHAALQTLPRVALEPIDGWLLFATNQASGDHVTPVPSLADLPPLATVELDATVTGNPETRQGGHVFVAMHDPAELAFEAAAFEPTRSFRDVVRALRPGDQVTVTGACSEGVVRLEKLEVTGLAVERHKTANPDCPDCGDRMKSKGRGAGYRCPSCGATVTEAAALHETVPRGIEAGTYEVPVVARRHLHRPAAWDTTMKS